MTAVTEKQIAFAEDLVSRLMDVTVTPTKKISKTYNPVAALEGKQRDAQKMLAELRDCNTRGAAGIIDQLLFWTKQYRA